jgi:hypothetical protein
MRKPSRVWWAFSALGLVLSLLCLAPLAAQADDKAPATGTWKWTFTRQNGDTVENTLKLKQDGDKLSGTLAGPQGNEREIKDGKVKDGDVSFTVTFDRNGQEFTLKFSGKLSGDTIKGKNEFEVNGETRMRDWEAKRA